MEKGPVGSVCQPPGLEHELGAHGRHEDVRRQIAADGRPAREAS